MSKRKSKDPSAKLGETEVAEEIETGAPEEAEKDSAEEASIEERLKAADTKAEEYYDRLLRVTAEFENYKKRMEREMNDFRKFANESLIKDILPIVDNLERALEIPYGNNESSFKGIRDGVQMTLKGLMESLEKFGVVPIDSLDKPFDPNFHQAVMQEESEGHPDNTVSKEFQKGYMMNDRLLRPAMVVVSKKPDSKPDVESKSTEDKHKVDIKIQ